MIRTQQKSVPWSWVMIMALPIFSQQMVEVVSGRYLSFTILKFTNDALIMTMLASVNYIGNFLISPYVAWKSDRIWTRFGRRKPFAIFGWLGLIVFFTLVPLAPNLWVLAVFVILYNFFDDFHGTYEPLYFETVPFQQRGRGQAIRKALIPVAGTFMSLVLVKKLKTDVHFDFSLGFLGKVDFVLAGEKLMYWSIAAIVLCTTCLIAFRVKETKPEMAPDANERFSFRYFFKGTLGDKHLQKVYLLVFAMMSLNMGLGILSPLLLVEQFGYSLNVMGNVDFSMNMLTLFVLTPIAGYLADKVDRSKILAVGIVISTVHPLFYWLFIHLVAPNNIPSIPTIIGFRIVNQVADGCAILAMAPLLFDYVPRKKMGTAYAGMTFVRGAVKILMVNSVGVFVKYYSRLFCPDGVTDYSSGLLMCFIGGLLGCFCAFYFIREKNAGRVIPYGKLEHEADAKREEEEKQAVAETSETSVAPSAGK